MSAGKAFCDGALHFAVGIEDTFVPQTRSGHRALDEYELTGHYGQCARDIELAAESGASAVRYGVPWYRVEPTRGSFEWTWLDRAVDDLLTADLTPIIDLVHYGTPMWLDNQALNADYPQLVADYAHTVSSRYADRLSVYTPANEPNINAEWCGETGAWPPYLTGVDGWVKIALAVARGMVLTQQAISSSLAERTTFVHVEAGLRYDVDAALDADHPSVVAVRQREQRDLLIEDLVFGLVDDAHPMVPMLLSRGVNADQLDWHLSHRAPADVMGVNFYPHLSTGSVTSANDDVDHVPPARGVSGVDGMDDVLTRFRERYDVPVMLTETSARADGDAQMQWLEDSVAHVVAMRERGFPIVGYTWFPLFDLIDWSYRTGSGPVDRYLEPLGLVRLVRTPDGFDRVPRSAFVRFQDLARQHGARQTYEAVVTQ